MAKKAMSEDDLLTTEQAAKLCKIAPRVLRRYAQEGEVPARRFGRDWVFRRGDVRGLKPRPRGYPKGRPRPPKGASK